MVFPAEISAGLLRVQSNIRKLKAKNWNWDDVLGSVCGTHSMEQSFLTNCHRTNQTISLLLLKLTPYYCVHYSAPLDIIVSRWIPSIFSYTSFQNFSNIIFRSPHMVGYFPSGFQALISNVFLGAFAYSRKLSINLSRPSLHLSACIRAAATGRMYVKVGIGDCYENLTRKFKLG
jgi:hypothetical protein